MKPQLKTGSKGVIGVSDERILTVYCGAQGGNYIFAESWVEPGQKPRIVTIAQDDACFSGKEGCKLNLENACDTRGIN